MYYIVVCHTAKLFMYDNTNVYIINVLLGIHISHYVREYVPTTSNKNRNKKEMKTGVYDVHKSYNTYGALELFYVWIVQICAILRK